MFEVVFQGLGAHFRFCGGIGGVSLVGPSWCRPGSGKRQAQLSPLEFFPYRAEMATTACLGGVRVAYANPLCLPVELPGS